MKTVGRYGEDLVARLFGFNRQPLSGGAWPLKEDLVKDVPREVAQVKTTRSRTFLGAFLRLLAYAQAEQRKARWFVVVSTGSKDYVFETTLVAIEGKGLDAVGRGKI